MRSPTVTPKLQRIAAQAAHDPDRVFTTLAYLIDEDFLREAYRQTSKASAEGEISQEDFDCVATKLNGEVLFFLAKKSASISHSYGSKGNQAKVSRIL